MAHLNQQQYDYRRESAANRMAENAEVTTLSEEQHESLVVLCSLRHEMHSNMDSCVKDSDNGIMRNLAKVGSQLSQLGIACTALPTSEDDYIDIDTIAELYEIEDVPEDDAERAEWYDDNYHRIYAELGSLNTKIEDYLRGIDQAHGTNYCPTGALRVG